MKKLFLGVDESKNFLEKSSYFIYAGIFSSFEEDAKISLIKDRRRLSICDLEKYFSSSERNFETAEIKNGAQHGFVEAIPLIINKFLEKNDINEFLGIEIIIDGNICNKYSKEIKNKIRDIKDVKLIELRSFNKGKNKYNKNIEKCFEYPYILEIADSLAHYFAFKNKLFI